MRGSQNYLLGLKGIIWDQSRGVFRSPSMQEFIWPREGWVEAECRVEPKHTPPGVGCSCGIYARIDRGGILPYLRNPNSCAVLVSANGVTSNWTEGFRSQAAQVVAVVRDWNVDLSSGMVDQKLLIGRQEQVTMIAAEYFQVDVIDLFVAMEMIRVSWMDDGYLKRGQGYDRSAKVRISQAR